MDTPTLLNDLYWQLRLIEGECRNTQLTDKAFRNRVTKNMNLLITRLLDECDSQKGGHVRDASKVRANQMKDSIGNQVHSAKLTSLEQLTMWCENNTIPYPRDMWDSLGVHFLGWQFADGSTIRFDDYVGTFVSV